MKKSVSKSSSIFKNLYTIQSVASFQGLGQQYQEHDASVESYIQVQLDGQLIQKREIGDAIPGRVTPKRDPIEYKSQTLDNKPRYKVQDQQNQLKGFGSQYGDIQDSKACLGYLDTRMSLKDNQEFRQQQKAPKKYESKIQDTRPIYKVLDQQIQSQCYESQYKGIKDYKPRLGGYGMVVTFKELLKKCNLKINLLKKSDVNDHTCEIYLTLLQEIWLMHPIRKKRNYDRIPENMIHQQNLLIESSRLVLQHIDAFPYNYLVEISFKLLDIYNQISKLSIQNDIHALTLKFLSRTFKQSEGNIKELGLMSLGKLLKLLDMMNKESIRDFTSMTLIELHIVNETIPKCLLAQSKAQKLVLDKKFVILNQKLIKFDMDQSPRESERLNKEYVDLRNHALFNESINDVQYSDLSLSGQQIVNLTQLQDLQDAHQVQLLDRYYLELKDITCNINQHMLLFQMQNTREIIDTVFNLNNKMYNFLNLMIIIKQQQQAQLQAKSQKKLQKTSDYLI